MAKPSADSPSALLRAQVLAAIGERLAQLGLKQKDAALLLQEIGRAHV